MLILSTALYDLLIQILQAASLRHWNPMIPAEPTHLSFYPALLMRSLLARETEHGLKPPVRPKGVEPLGLIPA
jgi:hypothetical protein